MGDFSYHKALVGCEDVGKLGSALGRDAAQADVERSECVVVLQREAQVLAALVADVVAGQVEGLEGDVPAQAKPYHRHCRARNAALGTHILQVAAIVA